LARTQECQRAGRLGYAFPMPGVHAACLRRQIDGAVALGVGAARRADLWLILLVLFVRVGPLVSRPALVDRNSLVAHRPNLAGRTVAAALGVEAQGR
jgi:hypothetical protein